MLSPISRLKEVLCFGETRRHYSASESFPTSAGMRTPNLSIRLETLYFFQIGNWYCFIPFADFEAKLLLDVCKLFAYKGNIKRQSWLHPN